MPGPSINFSASCTSCGSQANTAATSDTRATHETTKGNHSNDTYKPPFIAVMGTTDAGKSSFIKAINQAYCPPTILKPDQLDDLRFNNSRAETPSRLVADSPFRYLSVPTESHRPPKHTGYVARTANEMIGTDIFCLRIIFMSWISGTLMSAAFLYLDASMGLEQPSHIVQTALSLMKRWVGPIPTYYFPPAAILVLFLVLASIFAYSLMTLQLKFLQCRGILVFFCLWVMAGFAVGLFAGLTAAEFCLVYVPLILNIGLGCAIVRLKLLRIQLYHQAHSGGATACYGQDRGDLEGQ